jgi:hypothetical protein
LCDNKNILFLNFFKKREKRKMSNEPQEGIGLFIDIRNSSDIDTLEKKEVFSNFYQTIFSLQKKHKFYHISYVGDGILLFKRMDYSQFNELLEFLIELNQEFLEKELEEYGIGLSYGEVYAINVTNNINYTQPMIAGSVLDEAAKASDIANKVNYSIENNYGVRIVSETLMG